MNVDIERAIREDGPSIVQLLGNAGLPLDGLIDHLETAFVARVEGRIVGWFRSACPASAEVMRRVLRDPNATPAT